MALGALATLLIAVTAAAGAATPRQEPFEFRTRAGVFQVPRSFAPIGVWRTARVEPHYTDFFVARVPGELLRTRAPRVARDERAARDGVVVAFEALSHRRRSIVTAKLGRQCATRSSDGTHYCEYRALVRPDVAVKFRLEGNDPAPARELVGLLGDLTREWMVTPPRRPL